MMNYISPAHGMVDDTSVRLRSEMGLMEGTIPATSYNVPIMVVSLVDDIVAMPDTDTFYVNPRSDIEHIIAVVATTKN